MHLLELTCGRFRCLTSLRFTPGTGINVIRGENAQGKTSILEALLFAATTKSHRTATESDLVQRGEPSFRIGARAQRTAREVYVEVAWTRGAKRIKVNGVGQARMSDVLGKINVVIFSPEDGDLVRGSASHRRAFLDMELSQLHAPYLHALQRYRQAMKQRNETLRKHQPDPALLDVYDAQLVAHGVQLIHDRGAFVDQLAPLANNAYQTIAGHEAMRLAYRPDVQDETAFAEALAAARASDQRQCVTSRGPHRDDLDFVVDEKAARQFASQGQQKTAALAVKLAEVDLIRARTGEYPVLLLDDVFAELDAPRSQRVLATIPDGVQCLITTTDFALPAGLDNRCTNIFTVREGVVSAE